MTSCEWCGWLHSTWSAEHSSVADRLIRRKAIIAAAIATHPYSSSITQPGSVPHGRPSVRECHMTYVGIMLTLQMMISRVEADVRNGSSQRRYQANTTGAHTRDAAIGQANASGDHSAAALLSQVAVTNPTRTARHDFHGRDDRGRAGRRGIRNYRRGCCRATERTRRPNRARPRRRGGVARCRIGLAYGGADYARATQTDGAL